MLTSLFGQQCSGRERYTCSELSKLTRDVRKFRNSQLEMKAWNADTRVIVAIALQSSSGLSDYPRRESINIVLCSNCLFGKRPSENHVRHKTTSSQQRLFLFLLYAFRCVIERACFDQQIPVTRQIWPCLFDASNVCQYNSRYRDVLWPIYFGTKTHTPLLYSIINLLDMRAHARRFRTWRLILLVPVCETGERLTWRSQKPKVCVSVFECLSALISHIVPLAVRACSRACVAHRLWPMCKTCSMRDRLTANFMCACICFVPAWIEWYANVVLIWAVCSGESHLKFTVTRSRMSVCFRVCEWAVRSQ